ncbi:MAG: glycosyl hydrolase family 18 protein [Thermaerobacter sp.]|nr:glycosyl hydrolase family 18 protein [Thermaerobacter sp.]
MRELFERWRYQIIGGAALLLLIVIGVSVRSTRAPSASNGLPRQSWHLFWRPMVMGFYENGGGSDPGSWPSLQAHATQMQIVSPYWYRIDAGGSLTTDNTDQHVVTFAHQKKIRIWPLIGNAGQNPMYSTPTRAAMTKTIVDLVRKHNYDGAFIDFELLAPYSRDDLSTFLNSLGKELHAMGKGLGVAVFPKVGVTMDITHPYDYPALGHVTDSVVIMAYDHHYSGGPPGSVAPLPWVQKNLQFALRYIPKQRIYLGIAAYGYDWTKGGATTTVSTLQAQALLKKYGIQPTWDAASQEYHFRYVDNGSHDVWYEDQRSFTGKLAVARKAHIGGIAIWRLGYESPDVWTQLRHRIL